MAVWVTVRVKGEDWEVDDIEVDGYECIRWENETDVAFCEDAHFEKNADLVVDVTDGRLLVARAWFRKK